MLGLKHINYGASASKYMWQHWKVDTSTLLDVWQHMSRVKNPKVIEHYVKIPILATKGVLDLWGLR